ncbi:MAG: hypothetical protein Q9216_005747, partial [Gyalolechia sp. 2 TL-2023]
MILTEKVPIASTTAYVSPVTLLPNELILKTLNCSKHQNIPSLSNHHRSSFQATLQGSHTSQKFLLRTEFGFLKTLFHA